MAGIVVDADAVKARLAATAVAVKVAKDCDAIVDVVVVVREGVNFVAAAVELAAVVAAAANTAGVFGERHQ